MVHEVGGMGIFEMVLRVGRKLSLVVCDLGL